MDIGRIKYQLIFRVRTGETYKEILKLIKGETDKM